MRQRNVGLTSKRCATKETLEYTYVQATVQINSFRLLIPMYLENVEGLDRSAAINRFVCLNFLKH